MFGEKHGPVCARWCFDVFATVEKVCEEVNFTTLWVDSLDTLDEVIEDNFSAWVRTKGQNVLDMQWALKQLYYVLTQKLIGKMKEFTRAEMGEGNQPRSHNLETGADPRSGNDPESQTGAFGCCVTPQEGKLARRACRAAATLVKEVRELQKFPQPALSNDQKIVFLRQLANDDLEQFLSHLSASGGQTQETLRVYAESQIAQKRTAQSHHQGKTSDKKTEKTRGNAMDLGNLDNASKTDDQETRQE